MEGLVRAHGVWLRRLACALVREGTGADDAAQAAWVAVLERPPRHGGSVRSWLGTVLSNRVRNEARGRGRRVRREEMVGEGALAEPPDSPEEIAARVQAAEMLSAAIAALGPAYREVIHLRYYEDLEPVEIGRRLGVPGGTVRWRLKTALEELRRALDQQHQGDRRRWRALLLQIVGRERRPPAMSAARPTWPALAAGVGLALGAAAWLLQGRAPQSSSTVRPGPMNQINELFAPGGPPAIERAAARPAAIDCPSLRPLRDEIDTRRRELARPESPARLFERSPPNPAASQQLAALLDQAFARAGSGCEQTTRCQGVVCRVETMRPETVPDIQRCFPSTAVYWAFQERYVVDQRLVWRRPVHDPLARRGFEQEVEYLQLAGLEVGPVPAGARFEAPPVAPGRHRALVLPAGLSPACRAEGDRLKAEIEQAWAEQDRIIEVEEAFSSSVPSPERARELTAALGPALDQEDAGAEFLVECRGQVVPGARTPFYSS